MFSAKFSQWMARFFGCTECVITRWWWVIRTGNMPWISWEGDENTLRVSKIYEPMNPGARLGGLGGVFQSRGAPRMLFWWLHYHKLPNFDGQFSWNENRKLAPDFMLGIRFFCFIFGAFRPNFEVATATVGVDPKASNVGLPASHRPPSLPDSLRLKPNEVQKPFGGSLVVFQIGVFTPQNVNGGFVGGFFVRAPKKKAHMDHEIFVDLWFWELKNPNFIEKM